MLFVAPKARGKGVGRQLVEYLVRERGIRRVDVNEQNTQAAGFYARLGFRVTGRDATDPRRLRLFSFVPGWLWFEIDIDPVGLQVRDRHDPLRRFAQRQMEDRVGPARRIGRVAPRECRFRPRANRGRRKITGAGG